MLSQEYRLILTTPGGIDPVTGRSSLRYDKFLFASEHIDNLEGIVRECLRCHRRIAIKSVNNQLLIQITANSIRHDQELPPFMDDLDRFEQIKGVGMYSIAYESVCENGHHVWKRVAVETERDHV